MSVRGETPEKKWLDAAILNFIERRMRGIGVYEGEILENFAPISSVLRRAELSEEFPAFGARERKVQKAMSEAAVRRLVASGRIAVAAIRDVCHKSGQGTEKSRLFKPITILDALADVAS